MTLAANDRIKAHYTLAMMLALAFFQDLSLGTFPPGASRHITAAVTLVTAGGGAPKDFNSVKLPCGEKTIKRLTVVHISTIA